MQLLGSVWQAHTWCLCAIEPYKKERIFDRGLSYWRLTWGYLFTKRYAPPSYRLSGVSDSCRIHTIILHESLQCISIDCLKEIGEPIPSFETNKPDNFSIVHLASLNDLRCLYLPSRSQPILQAAVSPAGNPNVTVPRLRAMYTTSYYLTPYPASCLWHYSSWCPSVSPVILSILNCY